MQSAFSKRCKRCKRLHVKRTTGNTFTCKRLQHLPKALSIGMRPRLQFDVKVCNWVCCDSGSNQTTVIDDTEMFVRLDEPNTDHVTPSTVSESPKKQCTKLFVLLWHAVETATWLWTSFNLWSYIWLHNLFTVLPIGFGLLLRCDGACWRTIGLQ